MKFISIYKNGKPDYFFIALDASKHEFNFVQPYYIITDIDHTRHGSIREMNALSAMFTSLFRNINQKIHVGTLSRAKSRKRNYYEKRIQILFPNNKMKFRKKWISRNSATNIGSTTAPQKRVEELRFTRR